MTQSERYGTLALELLERGAAVRAPSGLLELLQRGVALEALGESGGSLGTEAVAAIAVMQTASTWEQRWVLRRVKGR